MGNYSEWNLKGKVVVVTGGSRGVGRGIAEELGGRGATVYVEASSRLPWVLAASRSNAITKMTSRSLRYSAVGIRARSV